MKHYFIINPVAGTKDSTEYIKSEVTKIFENLASRSSLVAVSELYTYFESVSDSQYDELLKNITLEDVE